MENDFNPEQVDDAWNDIIALITTLKSLTEFPDEAQGFSTIVQL